MGGEAGFSGMNLTGNSLALSQRVSHRPNAAARVSKRPHKPSTDPLVQQKPVSGHSNTTKHATPAHFIRQQNARKKQQQGLKKPARTIEYAPNVTHPRAGTPPLQVPYQSYPVKQFTMEDVPTPVVTPSKPTVVKKHKPHLRSPGSRTARARKRVEDSSAGASTNNRKPAVHLPKNPAPINLLR